MRSLFLKFKFLDVWYFFVKKSFNSLKYFNKDILDTFTQI